MRLQAESGMISVTGEPGTTGTRAGVSIADLTAGMYSAYGVMLALRVKDVDFNRNEIVVREGKGDWPYMEIHYTLTANGQTLDSGVAQLRDQRYMVRPIRGAFETDNLRFEKRMLNEWFNKAILKK